MYSGQDHNVIHLQLLVNGPWQSILVYKINCVLFNFTECANNFVEMVYKDISELSDLESVNISCVFLNRSNTSEKICYIAHQLCDRSRATSLKLNNQVHKKDPLYNIELDISNHLGQLYCSTTTAGNDSTYSVKVEGSFDFITGITPH